MGLTADFEKDPIGFLANYIIVVQDDREGVPKTAAEEFFLAAANPKNEGNNFLFLKKTSLTAKSTEIIPAYWLPWKKGIANNLTLGDKARFMFTSEMTNCRFSVLTGDMTAPKVSHVEGTVSPSKRDELEVAVDFPSRKDDTENRMRRFSVSGAKNPTRDKSIPKEQNHQYSGQSGVKSSAFVFGYRQDTTWKFYAQVVEGVMAGDGMDALKKAKDRVVPLDQAYEIA